MRRTDEQHASQWVSRSQLAGNFTQRVDHLEMFSLSEAARRALREAFLAGMKQARRADRADTFPTVQP